MNDMKPRFMTFVRNHGGKGPMEVWHAKRNAKLIAQGWPINLPPRMVRVLEALEIEPDTIDGLNTRFGHKRRTNMVAIIWFLLACEHIQDTGKRKKQPGKRSGGRVYDLSPWIKTRRREALHSQ